MTASEIAQEASLLPSDQVVVLVDALLDQIVETRDSTIDSAWASEAEDRIDAFDRGDLEAADGPTAISDLRNRLSLRCPAPPASLRGCSRRR